MKMFHIIEGLIRPKPWSLSKEVLPGVEYELLLGGEAMEEEAESRKKGSWVVSLIPEPAIYVWWLQLFVV